MHKKNDNKGSMTIEATLIVSALFIIIVGLIFSFVLLHQRTMLNKAALLAAQQGAEIWADVDRDLDSEPQNYREKITLKELYQQLFDFSREYEEVIYLSEGDFEESTEGKGTLQDRKFQKVRNMINSQIGKGILKPQSTKLTINLTNNLLVRKIEVCVKQDIKIPLGGVYSFFGGGSTLTLTGIGTAIVAEPDEYIRNIDLGMEYANKAVEAISIQNKIKELKEKMGGGG